MTHVDPDRDLRELFSRMKDEDRARAPAFRVARIRAVPRRRWPRWVSVATMGAAAAAIVVATLAVAEQRRSSAERDRTHLEMRRRVFTGTAWTSPTDFLLNTTTSHLLRAVPTFGPAQWVDTHSTSLRTRHRS